MSEEVRSSYPSTNFPIPRDGWRGDATLFDPDEVWGWFNRCIEDYTHHLGFDKPSWFKKWFSQFVKLRDEMETKK